MVTSQEAFEKEGWVPYTSQVPYQPGDVVTVRGGCVMPLGIKVVIQKESSRAEILEYIARNWPGLGIHRMDRFYYRAVVE
jgi:hypothetical protein